MDACDCLIVGGGPAGSSCARMLRRSGLEVVVLDKQRFPRDKVCAGWITPAVLELLELEPCEYASGRTLQPITGFRVRRMGDPEARVAYGRPVSFGIRRSEFDHYLLERSAARLRLGEPLKHLERAGDQWIANGEIRAPVVVGAGGHFCPVARHLGATLGRGEPIVAAEEVEFAMTPGQQAECTTRPDEPELFFTEDLKGYGWIFRKDGFLNIGLGRRDHERLALHLARFVAGLEAAGKIPRDLPRFRGHAYLLWGEAPRRLLDDGVLLIGDAAGLAYPKSGEGIRPAIESGLLAARVLLAAGGEYSQARLEPYRRLLRERFGRRDPRPGIGLSRLVPRRWLCAVAGRLMAAPWFARRVVVERWFLRSHQEPLRPRREPAISLSSSTRL